MHWCKGERTWWPLFLDQTLEKKVQYFATHLPDEHEQDFNFAR